MSDTEAVEMDQEQDQIELLRAKAEERRKRQEEEAKREEEQKQRLEIEKKQREEEEKKRREELLLKKKQEQDKLKDQSSGNKKEEMSGGSKLSNVLKAKEDMQKSPEQLEQEKREIISSRLIKLDLNGKLKGDLAKQAEDFYQELLSLYSQIYDLTEKFDRQKYDMMELAERARQIEKGKAKTRKSNIVHTGLGGSVFPTLAETFPHAPGKISLFSRYERVTDRRSFKDRRDIWAIQKEKKEFVAEKPKAKIKHVDEPKKEDWKPKKKQHHAEGEEHHEEEHHEEEHHEEEAPQEEAHEEE